LEVGGQIGGWWTLTVAWAQWMDDPEIIRWRQTRKPLDMPISPM
jgi:hypothetical protein